jgi:sulfur carrier protein
MIRVIVNGEEQKIDEGLCIKDFLAEVSRTGTTGMAIALNGEILQRTQYGEKQLKEGDSLELVQMTAGG